MSTKKAQKPRKDAKERLLEAAIKIFAIYGFEGASTRMLVKEAGVNISAIPYYFDSKDGLYEAVIRHIVSLALKRRGKESMEIRRALDAGNLTKQKAKKLLHDYIGGFSGFLISDMASPYIPQIIIREQMQPTPVFNILYEGFMRPLHETLTRLVAYLTGLSAESEQAILCATTIIGQLIVFKTHHEFVLCRTGWKAYRHDEAAAIIELVLQNTDAIIAAHRKTKS